MNRRAYVMFIASLVAHLSLAVWHYQGFYSLPAVCFLAVNFIAMIAIRDWIIGFEIFSVDRDIKKASHSRQQIFLFGSFRDEKDPFQKIHKIVSRIGTWKVRGLKYLAFTGWSLLCTSVIFPRLNLPLTVGLGLGFLASWVFLNSYQLSHYLLAQALSFLIVILAFLQSSDPSPWIYIPYIVMFFVSLSLFRLLTRDTEESIEKSKSIMVSSHFQNALNMTCVFVACSFLIFHMIDYFANQTQPERDRISNHLQKKIEDFANRKIEQYVSQQIEKENQNKNKVGAATAVSAEPVVEIRQQDRGRPQESSVSSEAMETIVQDLVKQQSLKKIHDLQERLAKEKELFSKLNTEFQQKRSKFVDLERKQALQSMERSRRQIERLRKQDLETVDIKTLQRDMKKKNLNINIAELQKILQSLALKNGRLTGQQNGSSDDGATASPDLSKPSYKDTSATPDAKSLDPKASPHSLAGTPSAIQQKGRSESEANGMDGQGLTSQSDSGPDSVAGSSPDLELGQSSISGTDANGKTVKHSGKGRTTGSGRVDQANSKSGFEKVSHRGSKTSVDDSTARSQDDIMNPVAFKKNSKSVSSAMNKNTSIEADDKAKRVEQDDSGKALLEKTRIKELQMKINQIFAHLVGLLKIVFVFSLGFLIYRLSRHFKKYKINETIIKQVGLSDEKKQNIQRKVGVLRQSRLSPDQEVRQTYRFFLEAMAMADFPKSQWCPATDFQWQVQQEFVGFADAIQPITESFCKSEYGRKTISPEELDQLRKARDLFVSRIVA